jgi:gas vesicle protein
MAKIGNTIATLLVGAAAGVAVGYILATDKETRKEDLEKLKKGLNNLKGKFSKKVEDMEEEIYHS